MNTLDAAIKSLLDARRALVSESRLIEKRMKQIDKALALFDTDPTTGTQGTTHKVRAAYQGVEEYERRRALVDEYVEGLAPGYQFTTGKFIRDSGEQYDKVTRQFYGHTLLRMVRDGDPRLVIAAEGAGTKPTVFRRI